MDSTIRIAPQIPSYHITFKALSQNATIVEKKCIFLGDNLEIWASGYNHMYFLAHGMKFRFSGCGVQGNLDGNDGSARPVP